MRPLRKQPARPGAQRSTHKKVVIVGTGFAGLGMAIRLKQQGEHDFVLLERGSDVGGTWRDNTYPGCRCDVPSHLYSFSFAPNPNWSSTFSPQAEILDYLRGCARRYGVLPHVRFEHEVTAADWDDERQMWLVETSRGDFGADVLVAAQGGLSEPSTPKLPGIERFEGTTFHSATWDHDHDLTGERIAVIGTGASAIQFVPEIQPRAGRLHVFQRTAPWVMPRRDRPITRLERAIYKRLPAAQLAMRAGIYWGRESFVLQFRHPNLGKHAQKIALKHIQRQVRDPELRRKITPDYAMGCKRILPSNDWYPALQKPNVELVTDGISEVRERSIVAADGSERPVDTIIFGTGFHVTDLPIAHMVSGRHGRTLDDVWDGSPEAYLGTTVAGFPNAFFLVGPGTGLGHTSIVFMIESQVNYVLDALRTMRMRGARTVEVREEAQRAYTAEIDRKTKGTVWVEGGCQSWYIDKKGRTILWPTFTWPFRERTRRFDEESYELGAPKPQPAPVAA
jgi:cation diffusion facilitator CzcD-associated flavoprotein CzcO